MLQRLGFGSGWCRRNKRRYQEQMQTWIKLDQYTRFRYWILNSHGQMAILLAFSSTTADRKPHLLRHQHAKIALRDFDRSLYRAKKMGICSVSSQACPSLTPPPPPYPPPSSPPFPPSPLRTIPIVKSILKFIVNDTVSVAGYRLSEALAAYRRRTPGDR
eukprot:747394-Hanusia_phi.AAC.1